MENASNIVQGQRHGSLSVKGREQALKIARRLRSEKFDAVYSSDLNRAFQTAVILLKNRESPRVIADQRLREQGFGTYEGKPLASMLRQMKRENADFTTFNPQNGESADDFRNRVKAFLVEVKARHSGHTVVLVTHNGVIKVLLDILSCQPVEGEPQNIITNGAITFVNIDRLGHVAMEAVNCVEHLSLGSS